MPTINQLPAVSTATGSDLLPIYSSSNGDARKMSLTTLMTYFRNTFTSPTVVTTISTPADGFTITLPDDSTNQWALIRQTVNCATGTVILPLVTNCADGQEIQVTTTLQVASFTVNGNGATAVYGAPLVLAAEDNFKLRFNITTLSWYKIA